MTEATLQEIEANIKKHKKAVDFADALERLQMNKDFKAVIQTGFLQEEAVRLVHLKADPDFRSAESQQLIVQQLDAIGALHQYFETMFQKASMAHKSMAADEEMREELLNEEPNHG